MSAQTVQREFIKGLIDREIQAAVRSTRKKGRSSFLDLLKTIQKNSDLLRPSSYGYRTSEQGLRRLVRGLSALSEHRDSWCRPAWSWEPRGTGILAVFSSLAHHLLAKYPVPPFLLASWFEKQTADGKQHRTWFLKLARGEPLLSADFPIPLNRRMIHEFTQAPIDLRIGHAVRWAQVRGLGGGEGLAMTLARSRLGHSYDNEDFWSTVVLFLVKHARHLDFEEIPGILKALHDRKYEPIRVRVDRENDVELDPPQPNLCLKGWTLASLRRRTTEWKAERERDYRRRIVRWEATGIGEYRREDEESRVWTIRELLDKDALAAEGKAMHHCVASYASCCVKHHTSIWSLGIEGPQERRRLLTIEVIPETKEVVQAKMNCNEDPDERCKVLLGEWASREGLTIQLSD